MSVQQEVRAGVCSCVWKHARAHERVLVAGRQHVYSCVSPPHVLHFLLLSALCMTADNP